MRCTLAEAGAQRLFLAGRIGRPLDNFLSGVIDGGVSAFILWLRVKLFTLWVGAAETRFPKERLLSNTL